MASHKSQRNEIAGLLRTSAGDLAFLLQEERMDAIVKVLESAGATPEPGVGTAHPALWPISYPHAISQGNGATHLVAQEKI
jgi:hypothetical protein